MSNDKTRDETAFSNWEVNKRSLLTSKNKTGFPEEDNAKVFGLSLKTV